MTNLCQALRCLPNAGGLLDQDPRDVYMIECVLTAQAERQKMDYDRQRSEAQMRR
jgi:hypothetical protein